MNVGYHLHSTEAVSVVHLRCSGTLRTKKNFFMSVTSLKKSKSSAFLLLTNVSDPSVIKEQPWCAFYWTACWINALIIRQQGECIHLPFPKLRLICFRKENAMESASFTMFILLQFSRLKIKIAENVKKAFDLNYILIIRYFNFKRLQ